MPIAFLPTYITEGLFFPCLFPEFSLIKKVDYELWWNDFLPDLVFLG